MPDLDLVYEASRTLRRIQPKIQEKIDGASDSTCSAALLGETIDARLAEHWPRLFELLYRLYGAHYDFF